VIRSTAAVGSIAKPPRMAQERRSRGGPLLEYPPCSTRRNRHERDRAIANVRDVEDDVDAVTPVDAENAPTGVWKSRKEREIPTAPTSIIFSLTKRKHEEQNHSDQLSTESDQPQSRSDRLRSPLTTRRRASLLKACWRHQLSSTTTSRRRERGLG
jgi:hypothetical protein